MVTTLAGSPNTPGLADGVGSLSSFNCPNGVAISGAIAIVVSVCTGYPCCFYVTPAPPSSPTVKTP